jgi:hypothetical protein
VAANVDAAREDAKLAVDGRQQVRMVASTVRADRDGLADNQCSCCKEEKLATDRKTNLKVICVAWEDCHGLNQSHKFISDLWGQEIRDRLHRMVEKVRWEIYARQPAKADADYYWQ